MIDKLVARFPSLETPLFLGLALVPISLGGSGLVAKSITDILDGIASLIRGVTLRHWVLSARRPLASMVEALLTYMSVNLVAQAFPASFAIVLPNQLKILDPNGDGVLTGTEIESSVADISRRVLLACLVTFATFFFLLAKEPPLEVKEGKDLLQNQKKSLLCKFWRGVVDRRGGAVIIDLFMTSVAYALCALRWFQAAGIDPHTVLAFGGVGGLAVGLASQSLVGNFISGLLILVTRPFSVGDEVHSDEMEGIVKGIGWNYTEVESPLGHDVKVPNANISSSKCINKTSSPMRGFDVEVPVRFPVGGFKNCQEMLNGLEVYLNADDANKEIFGGRKHIEPVAAHLKGLEMTHKDIIPVLLVEVRLENVDIDDDVEQRMMSKVNVAVISYILDLGYSVPGLEMSN